MLPLRHIISKFKGILYHCYAVDIQMYVSFKSGENEKLTVLHCSAIKNWMANNFLQLNADKTEVLIASDSIASKVVQCIGSLSSAVQSNLTNLCVNFDQAM